jgi:hypothetical protein
MRSGTRRCGIFDWVHAGDLMPEDAVIVWDLETIPDLEAAARMLDMV